VVHSAILGQEPLVNYVQSEVTVRGQLVPVHCARTGLLQWGQVAPLLGSAFPVQAENSAVMAMLASPVRVVPGVLQTPTRVLPRLLAFSPLLMEQAQSALALPKQLRALLLHLVLLGMRPALLVALATQQQAHRRLEQLRRRLVYA